MHFLSFLFSHLLWRMGRTFYFLFHLIALTSIYMLLTAKFLFLSQTSPLNSWLISIRVLYFHLDIYVHLILHESKLNRCSSSKSSPSPSIFFISVNSDTIPPSLSAVNLASPLVPSLSYAPGPIRPLMLYTLYLILNQLSPPLPPPSSTKSLCPLSPELLP